MTIRRKIEECTNEILDVLELDKWTLELLILPIICGGHVVIQGMIGTGKSVAIMALANIMDLKSGMYQCHPDTMPGDLIGFEIFNQKTRDFEIRPGSVLKCNMFLVDEINRMSPRSQAALLGPMAQGIVTIGESDDLKVPKPFVVYATMNPIESQGVYSLSEAQIDRFMFQIPFPFHSYNGIAKILSYANADSTQQKIMSLKKILKEKEIIDAQEEVNNVPLGDAMKWITAIYLSSCPMKGQDGRAPEGWKSPPETDSCVQYGPSPRALRDFAQAARGLTYLREKPIEWEDVAKLAIPVLRHRIILRRQVPEEYRHKYRDGHVSERVDTFIKSAVEAAHDRWKNLPDFTITFGKSVTETK